MMLMNVEYSVGSLCYRITKNSRDPLGSSEAVANCCVFCYLQGRYTLIMELLLRLRLALLITRRQYRGF